TWAVTGEVWDSGDVAGSPCTFEDATFAVRNLQGWGDFDAAALFDWEVGGASQFVCCNTGGPDQGVGVEGTCIGLVGHVDQFQVVIGGRGQRSVQQDFDAAGAEFFNHGDSLFFADFWHDAAHGLDQHDSSIGLCQAWILGDCGAHEVFYFTDEFCTGESATNDNEGQGLAALFGVGHQSCGFNTFQDLVANADGFFDAL